LAAWVLTDPVTSIWAVPAVGLLTTNPVPTLIVDGVDTLFVPSVTVGALPLAALRTLPENDRLVPSVISVGLAPNVAVGFPHSVVAPSPGRSEAVNRRKVGAAPPEGATGPANTLLAD